MAEEEKIVHHAKEAVHALTNKEKKWKEKVKDFLLEILIIIIAVSITLWFHNWNDRKHEREQEKEFLISVRSNFNQNKTNLDNMIAYFSDSIIQYYDTVLMQIKNKKVNANYVDSNSYRLLNFRTSNFNLGLFESFKSSGNLRLIENPTLLSDLTQTYNYLQFREEQLRKNISNIFEDYDKYVGTKCGAYDTSLHIIISPYLTDANVLYFIQKSVTQLHWLIINMHNTSSAMHSILNEIDTELKDRFDYDVSDKK